MDKSYNAIVVSRNSFNFICLEINDMSVDYTRTIFIVDDDENDLILFKDAFKEGNLKHNLRFFRGGKKLLDDIKEGKEAFPPDLVVTDLRMPGMSGLETVRLLRGWNIYRDIPIVMVAQTYNRTDKADAYKAGIDFFTGKPSSFQELVITVRAIDLWLQTFITCKELYPS